MIVLVCGGRDFNDRDLVFWALDKLERDKGTILGMVHGYARGADLLADLWMCHTMAYEELAAPGKCLRWLAREPADWARHGLSAGPKRNQKMLDGHPGIRGVIAFPGGRGTADMVARARAKGLPVWQPTATGEQDGQ